MIVSVISLKGYGWKDSSFKWFKSGNVMSSQSLENFDRFMSMPTFKWNYANSYGDKNSPLYFILR